MIDHRDIQARTASLADLVGKQLGVRGKTLEKRVARAGRLLPKWARRDLGKVIEANRLASHPKLARMIDAKAFAKAEERVTRYLRDLNPQEARKTALLRLVGLIVLNLLIVVALFLWVARSLGHF